MFYLADSVKISSRSTDGSVTLSFETGEYQREEATKVFLEAQKIIDSGRAIKITAESAE